MITSKAKKHKNTFRLFPQSLVQYFCLSVLLSLSTTFVHASDNDTILLGQSCALSGPARNLGLTMRAGLQAAIAETNDRGGVKGRTIQLRSKDDGYEPDKAIKNTLELIQDDQVFLLIGEVGTPTSKAVLPIIDKYKIPFFAPLTGAKLLRTPARPYVINIRKSYCQEMEALVSHLTDTLGMQQISCFYQNDSYGFAGLDGIKQALAKRDMQLTSIGSYERNTIAVMGGMKSIYKENPEAILLVGTYAACSEFIKLSKAKYPGKRIFGNISFVGTKSLQEALGYYGKDVIVSQVVPFPWDNTLPLVTEYRRAMAKYQHNAPVGFISLEGYIAGKLFAAIAEAVVGELTREKFIETMYKVGKFDLGGVEIAFNTKRTPGMNTIGLTTIYPKIQKLETK